MKKTLSPRQVFERSIRESDVVGAIRNLLEVSGARVFEIVERIPWGRRTSTPGIPDLMCWWPDQSLKPIVHKGPLHFFIEVKRPGGKLRPSQVTWITQAKADGVICFMADSVEAMVTGFREYGIEIRGA